MLQNVVSRRAALGAILTGSCLAALIGGGCGSNSTPTPPLAIADADNQKSFYVPRGTIVTLTLTSNATTGYQWVVTKDDAAVLTLTAPSTYVAPPAGSPPGAGGSQVFTFKAGTTGITLLELQYQPPGSGGSTTPTTPAKLYQVTFNVV